MKVLSLKNKTKDMISSRNILIIISIIISLTTIESCSRAHTYYGKSEIISKQTDSSLKDSVLIYGDVFSAVDNKTKILAIITVNGLERKTYSNRSGEYSLKLPSGVYTINCQDNLDSNEFIETINDVMLLPNEKIQINFYIGQRVE